MNQTKQALSPTDPDWKAPTILMGVIDALLTEYGYEGVVQAILQDAEDAFPGADPDAEEHFKKIISQLKSLKQTIISGE